MYNYNEEEIQNNPVEVLQCLLTMYDAKGNAQANIIKKLDLPSEEEFKEDASKHANFRTDDPSKYYDITGKLGAGGFARVFKVQRKADNFECALKFIEPKSQKERNIIYNEVALMRMHDENTSVLRCIEAYDFKNRLWIFVELMDDALTGFIETLNESYSENVCKYILHQSLVGLSFLH